MTEVLDDTQYAKMTDYEAMFAEAQAPNPERQFHLPAPSLDRAIETAMGDILLMKADADGELHTARYEAGKTTRREIRAVSEKEYLESMRDFLDECAEVAKNHDPDEIAKDWGDKGPKSETFGDVLDDVMDFRENLVYVNNTEFEMATNSMAEKIIADAEAGMVVGAYAYIDRSPRYVTVKVMDKVRRILESTSNYTPEEAQVIRDRIVFSDNESKIAYELSKKHLRTEAPIRIYAIDDFVLSGTNMRGALGRLDRAAEKMIIAKPDMEIRGMTICSRTDEEEGHAIDSVFIPPKSKNFTTIAVAGSWSSTDYGYESVIETFTERLGVAHPADREDGYKSAHQIKGRYERGDGRKSTPEGAYFDPQYAEEYQKVVDTFGITN